MKTDMRRRMKIDRRRRLVRREMKTIVVECLMGDESVVSYECLYFHSTISARFSESDFEPQHPQKTKFMTGNVPCDLVKLGRYLLLLREPTEGSGIVTPLSRDPQFRDQAQCRTR